MAIGINKVYRTVLSIANKEQGGFITPDNIAKIGGQVQLSIMEDNIVEYKNLINKRTMYDHAEGYGDLVDLYKAKLDAFLKTSTASVSGNVVSMPSDVYKLLGVYSTNRATKYEEVKRYELNGILSSPLTQPTTDFPIFYNNNANSGVTLNPTESGNVSLDYFKFPEQPRWGYFKNSNNGAYIYDSNTYNETGLVVKENALQSIASNITGGVDGNYSVTATRSDVGTIDLDIVVTGGVVSQIDVPASGQNFTEGVTLTVEAGDLGVTGPSSPLVITVTSSDIYSGSTAGTVNFELHPSDEVRLVTDILAYMGITVRDATISQVAGSISQTKEIAKQG